MDRKTTTHSNSKLAKVRPEEFWEKVSCFYPITPVFFVRFAICAQHTDATDFAVADGGEGSGVDQIVDVAFFRQPLVFSWLRFGINRKDITARLNVGDDFLLTAAEKADLDKDIENCDKYYLEESVALDKNLIAISGASFSVSLAFIDKIINLKQAEFVWSFWLSMGLLLSCIMIITVSFWVSVRAFRFQRDTANEARQRDDRRVLARKNKWNLWVSTANNTGIILFVLGLLFLAFFIFWNGIFIVPM